jgi:hypothetical protein
MPPPGMTAAKTVRRQIPALHRSMPFKGLKRIGRAGRLEPAAMSDPGRQKQPVGPDRKGDNMG